MRPLPPEPARVTAMPGSHILALLALPAPPSPASGAPAGLGRDPAEPPRPQPRRAEGGLDPEEHTGGRRTGRELLPEGA